ncbi:hypothetical protein SAMN05880501_108140 [Ureibacillus xyleni]|uniref:Uncharacterized protein n=1 Tax=Ureibacillus xyleni TaxID=614648 RepID=A0A285T8A5_9BACL|nr:hypothetical protein [Ureibacillus xyleni]SOC15773.1 hypothetical protein SAMN05880501_108140 [Ureibacillus xyleni]
MSNLLGILSGFIPGTIIYFICFFFGIKAQFTDDDTLTLILSTSSVSLVLLLFIIDNGNGILTFLRGTVISFSYHAVFWYFTVNHYNYHNAWEAVGVGFVSSAIYLVIILFIGFLFRKFNISRLSTYIQRVKQEKDQTKLEKEISWLNNKANKILNEMNSTLSHLDKSFTKTPSDSRNLLFLLSSVSTADHLINLGQQNVKKSEDTTLKNLNQLISSIKELKDVTNKVKLYQNINAIKGQIAELERTVLHLDRCIKKQDKKLIDIFNQEDERLLFIDQVKIEYRNLVNQLNNKILP